MWKQNQKQDQASLQLSMAVSERLTHRVAFTRAQQLFKARSHVLNILDHKTGSKFRSRIKTTPQLSAPSPTDRDDFPGMLCLCQHPHPSLTVTTFPTCSAWANGPDLTYCDHFAHVPCLGQHPHGLRKGGQLVPSAAQGLQLAHTLQSRSSSRFKARVTRIKPGSRSASYKQKRW